MNDKDSVANSNLDFSKKTIIFAHGYSAYHEGITPTRIRDGKTISEAIKIHSFWFIDAILCSVLKEQALWSF